MAYGVEGRMPFLDHRIVECAAEIKSQYFIKKGMRKFPLRHACRAYLTEEIYNRTDKIGFYTPLKDSLYKESDWVIENIRDSHLAKPAYINYLKASFKNNRLSYNEMLILWRLLSISVWQKLFNVN
jgi:asparagine synthase (glutamine-hydrolysing)